MLPGIAKVIEIRDLGFAGFEDVQQLRLAGIDQRLIAPIIAIAGRAVFGARGGKGPEMRVGPAHRRLHDVMQGFESNGNRQRDFAPDLRVSIA